jgi:hypothetical protein
LTSGSTRFRSSSERGEGGGDRARERGPLERPIRASQRTDGGPHADRSSRARDRGVAPYWEQVDTSIPVADRALVAFEYRWIGSKSLERARFLLSNFVDRYDAFHEALDVLRRWRSMDAATRQVVREGRKGADRLNDVGGNQSRPGMSPRLTSGQVEVVHSTTIVAHARHVGVWR